MSKEAIEKIQELYCKWCPKDCQNLTRAEKLGCLASGGFADELESLSYVQPDEIIKEIDAHIDNGTIDETWWAGYKKVKK